MDTKPIKLGVLGGTSLMELELTNVKRHQPMTPFGPASADFVEGTLPNGHRIVFLPRHGNHHQIPPSTINYQANIYGLKKLGVTHVLSISAVGSLEEGIKPGGSHFVVPHQLFDVTKGLRKRTFFEQDLAVHVPMGEPFCPEFRATLIQSVNQLQPDRVHTTGTLVVIEGPQFSTAAESLFYKYSVPEAAVIGMTAVPEAGLAREAGLHYGIVCLPADYDAWRAGKEAVTANEVKAGLAGFGRAPLRLVNLVTEMMSHQEACDCDKVLQGFAVHTAMEARPDNETNRILGVPFDA
jgi:5'-methylthioadenosine phosphorylase